MIKIEDILKYIRKNSDKTQHNKKIYEILEGDLLTQLVASLRLQLSGESSILASQRAAPINVLVKIVHKLSTLYSQIPTRTAKNPQDQELIDYYSRKINKSFGNMNESFNAYKMGAIEIYEDEMELKTRSIPPHLFLPFSDDKVDPLRMTAFIKQVGEKYWMYTNDSFVAFNSQGEIIAADMLESEGMNPFGVMPVTYIQKSDYELIPLNDTDMLTMTLLIPVLLTDLNFASMFLSQPILYGVDVDAANLKLSPNNFWNLKSEIDGKTPQVGVLRAEPDLAGQMKNIVDQLNFWLSSKDIRPGVVGTVNADNFSSGIAKIISEMDTLENRKAQEEYFRKAEKDFWMKLAVIHNDLARAGRLDERMLFSDPYDLDIEVIYCQDLVMESRADKVARLKLEVEAGFITKEMAIKELNPNMHEEQLNEILDGHEAPSFRVIDQGGMDAVPSKDNNTDTERV